MQYHADLRIHRCIEQSEINAKNKDRMNNRKKSHWIIQLLLLLFLWNRRWAIATFVQCSWHVCALNMCWAEWSARFKCIKIRIGKRYCVTSNIKYPHYLISSFFISLLVVSRNVFLFFFLNIFASEIVDNIDKFPAIRSFDWHQFLRTHYSP